MHGVLIANRKLHLGERGRQGQVLIDCSKTGFTALGAVVQVVQRLRRRHRVFGVRKKLIYRTGVCLLGLNEAHCVGIVLGVDVILMEILCHRNSSRVLFGELGGQI